MSNALVCAGYDYEEPYVKMGASHRGQLSYFSRFLVLKILFNLCVIYMFMFTGILGAGKRALGEENGTFHLERWDPRNARHTWL